MGAASIAALPLAAAAALIVERKHVKSFSEWRFADSPLAKMLGMGSSAAAPATGSGGSDYRSMAGDAALRHGIDPAMFQGLIQSESSWNPSAVSRTGATGLGQFTKGTARMYGLADRMDPAENLDASAHYVSDILRRNGGDWSKAIATYKGVSVGGATNADVQKAMRLGSVNPAASGMAASGFRQSVEVGGVSVFITQPAAGVQDIQRAVNDGIADALKRQSQFDIAQMAPAWG